MAWRGVAGGRSDLKRGRRRLVRSFRHWVSNIRDFPSTGSARFGVFESFESSGNGGWASAGGGWVAIRVLNAVRVTI